MDNTDLATRIVQIIIFDLILSGDNAVVIGVVASRLRGRNRRIAIVVGAGAAVVLRIGFASIATLLLGVPFIAAVGGVLLFWVGWRLLQPEGGGTEQHREAGSLREAIQLIILADIVMSLDNILAVAGAAHGNIPLLVFGLALSIPLLFVGAGLIAFVSDRVPLAVYVGSALIFRIGVHLVLHDVAIGPQWQPQFFLEHILPWVAALVGPLVYVGYSKLRGRPTIPVWVNPFRDRALAADAEHGQAFSSSALPAGSPEACEREIRD